MPELIGLIPVALGVGWLIGALGIGGVLLIPALMMIGGLEEHAAMATALFSFFFTGLAGTWLFQRRGSIDWRATVPVCVAALLFSFSGAWLNARTHAGALSVALAAIMIFAGFYAAFSRHKPRASISRRPRFGRVPVLAAVGVIAGFGSGFTGVGGPALSVPLMLLAGYPPLAAVGSGQVLQVAAALSGTIGNLEYGTIDLKLALLISTVEVSGVFLGVRFAHRAREQSMKRLVAALCVIVGALLLIRFFGSI